MASPIGSGGRWLSWVLIIVLLSSAVQSLAATAASPLDAEASSPLLSPQRPKVLVDAKDSAALHELAQRGATLLVEYETVSLWSVPAPETTRWAEHLSVVVRDDFNQLFLRNGTVNTSTGVPAVPANLRQATTTEAHFWLVHFVGPVKSEWFKQLQQIGLEPVIYMPQNAYLVWGNASARTEPATPQIIVPKRPASSNG